MGKVHIKLINGNEWFLKYVRNIPAMKWNLISRGKLGDSCCLSTFEKTWWKITKGALVITKGDRIGTLYLFTHNTDYSCWCNCNFRMYSLVYLMYCTPMFIPGSVCNVIESCHAPMFQSGVSIMWTSHVKSSCVTLLLIFEIKSP